MSDIDSLYVVQDVPGKGLGLIATSKISRGTRILAESPLIRLPQDVTSDDQSRRLVIAELNPLSENQRQDFFALRNSHPELGKELGIVKTNALPMTSDGGGIFTISSRINHSCRQNAQHAWNENFQKLTIHAIDDIEEGTEITIMYIGKRLDYATRQHALKAKFSFDCHCDLCFLPANERKVSDARLTEIKQLEDSSYQGGIYFSPLVSLHGMRKVLQLLKSEGIASAAVSRAYDLATQIATTHGDLARAKVFMERTLSTNVALEGEDSPDVQKTKQLIGDPSQHICFGFSTKWASAIEDIPQNLDDNDFENWLWRAQRPNDLELADLRNQADFPAFSDLPSENDLSLNFYQTTGGHFYQPSKHWAFLGEIVNIEAFFRLRLIVKDRDGHQFPIAFYTDSRGREIGPSMLRVGHTVVVLYGEQHGFLDLSVGIRHEEQKALKVFPVSLDDLMLLSDKVQTYSVLADGKRTCHGCNKESASLMKTAKLVLGLRTGTKQTANFFEILI
ncbi:hypothetical protein ACHAPJ_007389 [Fusarium lateritium]